MLLKIIIGILLGFLIILIARNIILKNQIRNIEKELQANRQRSYNHQLQITFLDDDLTRLAAEINRNLDYQKALKLEQEKSENALKQSISDIAHDLRTPLTVVKGNLQFLQKDEALSAKSREYVRVSEEKADILKNMVDDFFELSVLESSQGEVPLTKVNATNFLMQFILDHESVIRQQGFEPDIRLPEKTQFILADEHFLGRMLSNLLNNILKYGEKEFAAGLEETEDHVVLFFENAVPNGGDVDASRLFDRTYRGDAARQKSGAGLGLYIVKLLAEKQKAKVRAMAEGGRLRIELAFQKASEKI